MRSTVGYSPEAHFHEVEDITATSDEEQLHNGVVQRNILSKEEVEVPGNKDDDIQNLGLKRDSCRHSVANVSYANDKQIQVHVPRQDRLVCILWMRMPMEAKCDKSPA